MWNPWFGGEFVDVWVPRSTIGWEPAKVSISKTTPTLVWYVVIIRIVISLSIGGLYACLKIGETNTQLKFNYRDNDDELVHFGVTYFLFGPRISVLTFPSVIFAIIIAEQIPNFCCSDSPSLLI